MTTIFLVGPKVFIIVFKNEFFGGAWVAQSVEAPTSAQAMISQFMSSSPVSGSVLTVQSLGPASDSVSPSRSNPAPLTLCLYLCLPLSTMNITRDLNKGN